MEFSLKNFKTQLLEIGNIFIAQTDVFILYVKWHTIVKSIALPLLVESKTIFIIHNLNVRY